MLFNNRLFLSRTYEVGIISSNVCLQYCLSGPIARASGLLCDARLSAYDLYNFLPLNVHLTNIGDCFDRLLVRYREMLESSKMIYSCLYLILHMPLMNASVSSNMSHIDRQYSTSMEHIIEHFLINISVFSSVASTTKMSVESGKGIISLLISTRPYVMNTINNDMLAICFLNNICKDVNIGDVIALLGSIDFVLGSVDL
jgi:NADH:ubiquinone oxidoreductase subunit D